MTATTAKRPETWAWDQHWKTGALSSLSFRNVTTEAPEAQNAWYYFLNGIPDGAKVLDICTGNGLVPAVLSGFCHQAGRKFEVTGVDHADIDPAKTVKEHRELIEGFTFKGRVKAEQLPFEDESFDLVTSQYGIEYTDTASSVPEAARVLKKGGYARFVMHAENSVICRFNRTKVEQGTFFLNESGVLEALDAAVRAAFEGGNVEETRTELRDTAIAARERLAAMGENTELQQLLNNLVQAYIARNQFDGVKAFEDWLEGVRSEVEAQVVLIREMDRAALSNEGVEKLRAAFAGQGVELEHLILAVGPNKEMMARVLQGKKTGAK